MQVLKKIVNVDGFRGSVEKILLRQNSNSLVFIDTNFLTWIYRINKPSFNELKRFLYRLIQDKKLIIPNWVVHEYNSLLSKNSEDVFSPFKRRLKIAEREIDFLQETSRMILDDQFSMKKGYPNKRAFLSELETEIKSVRKKIGYLRENNEFKDESRGEFIEEIVKLAPGKANVKEIIKYLDHVPLRFKLRIPPGFEDEGKPENKYGDMIIWEEILANIKIYDVSEILFLSRDVKKDWVYTPPKIILNEKIIGNNQSVTYNVPQPWLEYEIKQLKPEAQFFIADMHMLLDVLYSPEHNFYNFEEFKHLAKTINLELKNSETNKVIEWLVSREEEMNHLRKTVCYWVTSPGEVEIDDLKKWGEANIDDRIDFAQVNWNEVYLQLFI